jgi:hypothetical protein
MASTDTASGTAAQPVHSALSKQDIRARVTELIKTKFANTLGQAFDIVNVFMALIYTESTFRTDRKSVNNGGAHTEYILKCSAVSNVYKAGAAQQRANIINSTAAYGLTQVLGYYVIKGCGTTGKSELEKLRPDLAGPLLVPPGTDVATKLNGDNNIDNQLLAGLIVLEGKYVNLAPKLVAKGMFSNKLTAAVSAYLGLGKSDAYGTTPEVYANSIIRGAAYQIANNGRGPDGETLAASGGNSGSNGKPGSSGDKTAASGNNLSVAGC